MAKFRECEFCGCHLDFGERCDCAESMAERTSPKGLSTAEVDMEGGYKAWTQAKRSPVPMRQLCF